MLILNYLPGSIVKLVFTRVLLLFFIENMDCGYSLEPPRQGGSNVYLQLMFRAKILKISKKFLMKFPILKCLYITWKSFCTLQSLL